MNRGLTLAIFDNFLKQLSRRHATTTTRATTTTEHTETQSHPKKSPGYVVGLAQPPDPQSVTTDYIGPPDAKSNLRPYIRHYDEYETEMAKKLRLLRIEVEKWNMDFWTKHNQRFYEEKNDFIRMHKLKGTEEISADQMSVFYKQFLDKNRRIHILYNISWYFKNFDMLTLDCAVKMQKLLSRLKRKP